MDRIPEKDKKDKAKMHALGLILNELYFNEDLEKLEGDADKIKSLEKMPGCEEMVHAIYM